MKIGIVNTATGQRVDPDGAYVGLAGNQTIAGVKTFSSYPLLPEAAPSADREPAPKGYVDELTADYSPTLATDHTYSGMTTTEAVGESVVFGDLLYFDWADKEYKKAAKGAAATMPVVAIALETKGDGDACLLLRRGFVRDDSWAFAAAVVMVGDSAAPTTTLPATSTHQVQRIGTAISEKIMWFDPSSTVVEVP
jgi:hypothetical protein